MRRIVSSVGGAFLLTVAIFFNGCGGSGSEGANTVGSNLENAEVLESFTPANMLPFVQAVAAEQNTTRNYAFGVKSVKITYKTINQDGKEVNASGLLMIPVADASYYKENNITDPSSDPFTISSIVDNHGTIFLDSDAPSNDVNLSKDLTDTNPNLGQLYATMVAYAGFAVIAPDYIGYGDSKGVVHPYILKKASARASLDMLRASMRYMIDHGYLTNGQVYVSGYSEGGYVAMAMAEDIQENHSGEFNIMGVAPMAGPYDVEALGAYDLNASMKMVFPAFLAEITYAYSYYYDDLNLSDLVVKPEVFDSVDLFGGDYNEIQIHTYLGLADPANGDYGFYTHYTNELFKDSFINDYQTNLNDPVRIKFAENSVYNWTPKMKMNIIQCQDDEIIPYKFSSLEAYDTMKANGATDINLTTIPTAILPAATPTTPFIHQRCAGVAYGAAINWFNQIREESKK